MDLFLRDKIIIITGDAKGIGEGLIKVLLAEGAIPVMIRNEHKRYADILKTGAIIDYFSADLADPDACKYAVGIAVEKYGQIDCVVNNGGGHGRVGLENGNYHEFIDSLQQDLIHYYIIVQHALPWLRRSRGSVVNLHRRTCH